MVAFHTTEDILHEVKWLSSTSIQSIQFFSRFLMGVEKNYQPTELEIMSFVQIIKKLRYLVKSSYASIMIQTDHSTILDIMQQLSITSTSSTIKMNIYLIRVFQFFQQFRLVVCHKLGQEHIIPDGLSRLASANRAIYKKVYSELDALFIYYATLVEISPKLIKHILDDYLADDQWVKVQRQLFINQNLGPDKAILSFVFGSTKPPSSADSYFLPKPKLHE